MSGTIICATRGLDEVLDVVAKRRQISPAIALHLKEMSAARVDVVCSRLQPCQLAALVAASGDTPAS